MTRSPLAIIGLKLHEMYCETRIELLRSKMSWTCTALVYGCYPPWQDRFFRTVFGMLAMLASADAKVAPEELAVVEHFIDSCLRLNARQKTLALRAFRQARDARTPFESLAKEYYDMFRRCRRMRENMLIVLLAVAYADARRCAAEDRLIEVARWVFCVDQTRMLKLKNRYFNAELLEQRLHDVRQRYGPATGSGARVREAEQRRQQAADARRPQHSEAPEARSYYSVLGVSPDDSMTIIKRRYRALVLKYHPDRVRAQGLGEDKVVEFQARFREVQEAYEQVQRNRAGD